MTADFIFNAAAALLTLLSIFIYINRVIKKIDRLNNELFSVQSSSGLPYIQNSDYINAMEELDELFPGSS
jgi:hypothetical protein